MKRIWVTDTGIIHYRKPKMDAKEYIEVTPETVVVPENPSLKMVDAGWGEFNAERGIISIYNAMIKVAKKENKDA